MKPRSSRFISDLQYSPNNPPTSNRSHPGDENFQFYNLKMAGLLGGGGGNNNKQQQPGMIQSNLTYTV